MTVNGTAPSQEAMEAAGLLLARILIEHEANRAPDPEPGAASSDESSAGS